MISHFCSCGAKHFFCPEYDITFLLVGRKTFFLSGIWYLILVHLEWSIFSCLEYDITFLLLWSKTFFPVRISPWHVFCDADVASLQHPSLPIQETSGHNQVRKIRPKNILSVLEVFKSNNNRLAAAYFWSSVHSGNLDVGVQDVTFAFVVQVYSWEYKFYQMLKSSAAFEMKWKQPLTRECPASDRD